MVIEIVVVGGAAGGVIVRIGMVGMVVGVAGCIVGTMVVIATRVIGVVIVAV